MKYTVGMIVACALALVVAAVAVVVYMRSFHEGFADENSVCDGVYYKEIPGFLTHDECDRLVETARTSNDMHDSMVGETYETGRLEPSIRLSKQTWFGPGRHSITDKIRNKSQALMHTNARCLKNVPIALEDVQVVRYGPNGKYDVHYDGDECDETEACPSDQRLATVLIYLNDGFGGGHTEFPLLNAKVVPQKGKALFFWVADPESMYLFEKTLHAGVPVTTGEKWIANQWIRKKTEEE